ncbi:unnamed protein product, partial [Effrenium voratum]
KDKALLAPKATPAAAPESPSEALLWALRPTASAEEAEAAMPRLGPLARGLVHWRWSRLQQAEKDLDEAVKQEAPGASSALLAFQLCMSRFPSALRSADAADAEVPRLVDQWHQEAEKLSSLFFPCQREATKGHKEIFKDLRQTDMLLKTNGEVLGLRLLMQCQQGEPITSYPLVLMFHGEDQSVDTFCEEDILEPWREAKVNLLIAGFRGYGFSTGTSSHYHLRPDGEAVVEALPELLKEQKLWPYPGELHLAGTGGPGSR